MTDSHLDLIVGDDGKARPTWAASSPLLRDYYDTEWGNPVRDETGLYERIVLEGFQAGLSWETILRKRPAFRAAFAGFDPDIVASFGEQEVQGLLDDASIIRNRRKIEAAITNAQATVALRDSGGLVELVWSFQPDTHPAPEKLADIPAHTPESTALARALKENGFVFVGPTTMYALMQSVGLVNDHLAGSWRRDPN